MIKNNIIYPSLRDRLHTQHHSIEVFIAQAAAEVITKKPTPEKWSVHDQLAHLTRYQQILFDRLTRMLTEDNPAFERYVAEDDRAFPQWQNKGMEELIYHLKSERQELVAFVNTLTDEQLSRTGMHPKFGKLNIIDWLEFFVLHEAHHLYAIFQLVKTATP